MEIPPELQSMLDAEHGPTKQKAARLVVDLAASAVLPNSHDAPMLTYPVSA